MFKIVLSVILERGQDDIKAQVVEFPDIKVSALSVGSALARLREAVWQRMRWTKIETTCHGEPISPIPEKLVSQDLVAPIEVDLPTSYRD